MRLPTSCLLFTLLYLLCHNSGFASSSNELAATNKVNSAASNKQLEIAVNKYLLSIEKIEAAEGVYGNKLSQELLNLANVYQNYNKHSEAISLLTRSLHLNRVNEGLYSATQIPILEKLIKSLKATKQWNLVNDRYSYLYWLYDKNSDQVDASSISVVFKIANWYLQSYAMQRSEMPVQDLMNSYILLDKTANLISDQYGDTDIRLVKVLNRLMIANYFFASHVPTTTSQTNAAARQITQAPESGNKLIIMKRKSFMTGKNIIERELNILLNQQSIDHLNILKNKLKLADWYLMHNKKQSAKSFYQDAYDFALKNKHHNVLIKTVFDQPVALPDFPSLDNSTRINLSDKEVSEDDRYVQVTLDVTSQGRTRNLKVINSNPPDNTRMKASVLNSLRLTKFRPRLENGIPTLTKNLQMHVFMKK